MAGGDAADPLTVIVGRRGVIASFLGLKADQPFFAKCSLDQAAQRFDGRVAGAKVTTPGGERGWRATAPLRSRNQSEQTAHRQAKPSARQKTFLVQISAQVASRLISAV